MEAYIPHPDFVLFRDDFRSPEHRLVCSVIMTAVNDLTHEVPVIAASAAHFFKSEHFSYYMNLLGFQDGEIEGARRTVLEGLAMRQFDEDVKLLESCKHWSVEAFFCLSLDLHERPRAAERRPLIKKVV